MRGVRLPGIEEADIPIVLWVDLMGVKLVTIAVPIALTSPNL